MPRTVTNARQRHFHSQRRVASRRSASSNSSGTARAVSPSIRDTFVSCTTISSASFSHLSLLLACSSHGRRARNVTGISSPGPTRRLCQPSRDASGDCVARPPPAWVPTYLFCHACTSSLRNNRDSPPVLHPAPVERSWTCCMYRYRNAFRDRDLDTINDAGSLVEIRHRGR